MTMVRVMQRGVGESTHSHTASATLEEDITYRHLCLDVDDYGSFTLDPVKPAAGGVVDNVV